MPVICDTRSLHRMPLKVSHQQRAPSKSQLSQSPLMGKRTQTRPQLAVGVLGGLSVHIGKIGNPTPGQSYETGSDGPPAELGLSWG